MGRSLLFNWAFLFFKEGLKLVIPCILRIFLSVTYVARQYRLVNIFSRIVFFQKNLWTWIYLKDFGLLNPKLLLLMILYINLIDVILILWK